MKMQRIIFLDIDGPVIPLPLYNLNGHVSHERSHVSTCAIGLLTKMCQDHGALIVTNTAHNGHVRGGVVDLKTDLINHGLKPEFFHEKWHTNFNIEDWNGRITDRMLAINHWMAENGEVDWVCFDDIQFTQDKRLVLIDFYLGIDYNSYKQALGVWKIAQRIGLI